jgi:hypothetical protein
MEVFPDFEGRDEFVKGCGRAYEALQIMCNESDILCARSCMTDTMFDVWLQAMALAKPQYHATEVVQGKVSNGCVVSVATDESEVLHFPPCLKLTHDTHFLSQCRVVFCVRDPTSYSFWCVLRYCCTVRKQKS